MSGVVQPLVAAGWVLYWSGLAFLAAGSAAAWLPRIGRWTSTGLLGAGAAALTASAAARWVVTGRPPVTGTFENSLVASVLIGLLAVALMSRGPLEGRTDLARLLAPWSVAVLGYGLLFEREPLPMGAAARSIVGYVHAFIGWSAFALLLGATMAALSLLVASQEDAPVREEALTRLLGAGFAFLTATMVSGSIYSFLLFSEWYRWQVVEVFTLGAWVAYALVLHARLMFGWRDRRLALSTLAVVPLMTAAFWIWSVYPTTYHYFETVVGGL